MLIFNTLKSGKKWESFPHINVNINKRLVEKDLKDM